MVSSLKLTFYLDWGIRGYERLANCEGQYIEMVVLQSEVMYL